MRNKIQAYSGGRVAFMVLVAILLAQVTGAQPQMSISFNTTTCHSPNVGCDCRGNQNIDAGEVEIGLTKRIDIVFSRITTNTVNAAVEVREPVPGNGNHWNIPSISNFDLDDDTPVVTITVYFAPQNISSTPLGTPIEMELIVHTNLGPLENPCFEDAESSPDNLDINLKLRGTAKKTTINYSLVLDRSGSMSTLEGVAPDTRRRIDMLADAASLFFDIERLRERVDANNDGDFSDPEDFDGDSVGMVKFSSNSAIYLPKDAVTAALIDDVKLNFLSTGSGGATHTSSKISPGGSTAIGSGVIRAVNDQLVKATNPDRKSVLILFSDGHENVRPYVGDPEVGTLLGDRQDVLLYSIGMGEASDPVMTMYSQLSGLGAPHYYKVPANQYNSDPYELSNFYFKVIYHHALDQEILIDPTYQVDLMDTTDRDLGTVLITSSDKKATFLVFDPPTERSRYTLEVVTPKGEFLSASTLSGGLAAQKISDRNYTIYEADFTKADSTAYVGNWTLRIFPQNGIPDNTSRRSVNSVPIGFSVSAFSDLQMDVDIAADDYAPGDEVTIVLTAEESGQPVDSKSQPEPEVRLTAPSGKATILKAIKDSYGKLVYKYPHTFEKGIYQVFVKARLKNAKGEVASREDLRHIAIGKYNPYFSAPEPCIACTWVKVLVILIFLIFIIMLLVIWMTRRHA